MGSCSRLQRVLSSEDFRRRPLRWIMRRSYWHIHWKIRPLHPFIVRFQKNMQIRLAQSSASSGIYLNDGFSDKSIARLFIDHLKPGMVAFDCGSHIGEYALLFAGLVGTTGQVHAFEPDPRVYRYLVENTARNGLQNVTLNNAALGNVVGPARFILRQDPTQSSLKGAKVAGDSTGETYIDVTTVDDYIRKNRLQRVDALKIDVEGAELAVVRGALETLKELNPSLIFIECDDHASAPLLNEHLKLLGYRVKLSSHGHVHPHLIARTTEN